MCLPCWYIQSDDRKHRTPCSLHPYKPQTPDSGPRGTEVANMYNPTFSII